MKSEQHPIIIMVDDDEDDCILARDAFEVSQAPGDFACLRDGMELLDYLYHRGKYVDESLFPAPTLILLDLNMPGMDGREVLREIKVIPDFPDIPVVVLTTSTSEKDIAFTHEMGAHLLITKSPRFDEWVSMMKVLAGCGFGPG
jgi:CheY-like chemotaxis protein